MHMSLIHIFHTDLRLSISPGNILRHIVVEVKLRYNSGDHLSEHGGIKMDKTRIKDYFDQLEGKITLGLDGFVDEVWQVLSKRTSRADYILFDRMRDFAKSVYDCGEGGYANEIIRKRRFYGGFTANTGKAL